VDGQGLRGKNKMTRQTWFEANLTPAAWQCAVTCFVGRCLPVYEAAYPDDSRPREEIVATYKIAFGLMSAARAADGTARVAWAARVVDAAAWAARAAAAAGAAGADGAVRAAAAAWAVDAVAWAARAVRADGIAQAAAAAAGRAAAAAEADAAAWGTRVAGTWVAAGAAERLAQSKLFSLFVPPAAPIVTDTTRGIVNGWLEGWWEGRDNQLARAVLADELEENGFADWRRLQALRELADWSPGMWPMVPDVVG